MFNQIFNSVSFVPQVSLRIIGLCGLGLIVTLSNIANIANAEDFTGTANFSSGVNYSVEINKTQIMQLPAPASAVVVGNPSIADISVHSPTLLFIVGRGYGTTNVIILDALGQTIMNADIHVNNGNSANGTRVMMAGRGWQSYACTPFCQPAPVLGDDPTFVAQFEGSNQAIDNTSSAITTTAISGTTVNSGILTSTFPNTNTNAPNAGPRPVMQQMQIPVPTTFDSARGDR